MSNISVAGDKFPTKDTKETISKLRPKRQITADAKTHLDAQITYILASLPFQIDLAEETIEKKVKFLVLNKVTWGWAVVIGALLDFYSDYAKNNRTIGNFGDISAWWGYGGKGFYGLGFGFPYLLSLPQDNLPCHASDFQETLDQYKLTNGLDELFATTLPLSAVRAIVSEFDAWVRIKIACITDSGSDYVEAAEVSYLLDELNAAMNLRIDVEEADRESKMKAEAMAESGSGTEPGTTSEASYRRRQSSQASKTRRNDKPKSKQKQKTKTLSIP